MKGSRSLEPSLLTRIAQATEAHHLRGLFAQFMDAMMEETLKFSAIERLDYILENTHCPHTTKYCTLLKQDILDGSIRHWESDHTMARYKYCQQPKDQRYWSTSFFS